MNLKKYDGAGNELRPGDVCVRQSNGKLEYVVYKKAVWGGNKSKGEFGRFITKTGETSIKFSNVLSAVRPKVLEIIRKYYEDK